MNSDSWTLRDAIKNFARFIQSDLCHPNHIVPNEDKAHVLYKIGQNLDRLTDSETIDDIQRYLQMQGLREYFEPLGAGANKLAFKVRNYVVTIQTRGVPDPVYNISRLIHPTHVQSFDKGFGKITVEISPYYQILSGSVADKTKFSPEINNFCKTGYLSIYGHCYPPEERIPSNFGQLPESAAGDPKLIIIDRGGFLPHIFSENASAKEKQEAYNKAAQDSWEKGLQLNRNNVER